jgi:hypothetical protein
MNQRINQPDPRLTDVTTFREAWIRHAMCWSGVLAGTYDYDHLIGPMGFADKRNDRWTMSGCGMVIRGLLTLFGFRHATINQPYRIGAAFVDLMDFCMGNMHTGPVPINRPGIVWVCGQGTLTHACVLLHCHQSKNDVWKVTTWDGGQVDSKNRQCVLYRERLPIWATPEETLGGTAPPKRQTRWWFDPWDMRHFLTYPNTSPVRSTPPLPPPEALNIHHWKPLTP